MAKKAVRKDSKGYVLKTGECQRADGRFCTRICENESNLKVIQDIMGHKDIQTTMDIYAECTQEKKQEVVTKLTGKIVIK